MIAQIIRIRYKLPLLITLEHLFSVNRMQTASPPSLWKSVIHKYDLTDEILFIIPIWLLFIYRKITVLHFKTTYKSPFWFHLSDSGWNQLKPFASNGTFYPLSNETSYHIHNCEQVSLSFQGYKVTMCFCFFQDLNFLKQVPRITLTSSRPLSGWWMSSAIKCQRVWRLTQPSLPQSRTQDSKKPPLHHNPTAAVNAPHVLWQLQGAWLPTNSLSKWSISLQWYCLIIKENLWYQRLIHVFSLGRFPMLNMWQICDLKFVRTKTSGIACDLLFVF